MKSKGKVLVGMSGGVDSSVAAALLLEQGYDCVGVYMNLWSDPTTFDLDDKKKFPQNKCCSIESLMFARSICQSLGMPFYSINFEDTFKEKVVDYFLEQHKKGETPNPCVRCNKTVKFGALFNKMEELGCDYLATGHYAKLATAEDGTVQLLRGADEKKDQTYFLYNLQQSQLQKLLFPLGEKTKPEVKQLAKDHKLKELDNRKESQGVCFYPEKTYLPFLKRYIKDVPEGEIKTEDGTVLGKHKGLPFYTVGQRKGLAIGGTEMPLFVNKVDKISNALIVGDEEQLYSSKVGIREENFLAGQPPAPTEELDIRIRHHGKLAKGFIKEDSEGVHVEFLEPQRAIMAGQSLVIYRGKQLIGGGIMV
jgi:tRNA-specific 2-thiouridylase